MSNLYSSLIYFFYGLAFFCMGLVILLEVKRCLNPRLRHALFYLAAFGVLHGGHEWYEMFQGLEVWAELPPLPITWDSIRLFLLIISFLALGAFGSLLLAPNQYFRRLAMVGPLLAVSVWAFGSLAFKGQYTVTGGLINVIDVWTRYTIAIPAALLASAGLVAQQREFRRVGMAQFGRDSLWAAVAFFWYGMVGQIFSRPSPLPPSNFINSQLFYEVFGIPIQLLRAAASVIVAIFVIRFLRSFEVETQREIAELQIARLEEAERREALRGELFRRVVAAQETERQRIARELHDETGQALTALGLGLRGVTTTLRQDQEKAVHQLRQLEGMVAHSLVELQHLISDLRPSHLDDLGLPATLRWYCNELQDRASITISVDVTGETHELPAEVKTALFRVAQEALTNVVKHARADQAWVRLTFEVDKVCLQVEDNGRGFDSDRLKLGKRTSWGLIGMEERTSLLGGELTLVSQPNQGTRVQVCIPYLWEIENVHDEDTLAIGG